MAETLVGVIGKGWVGKSMVELFPEAIVYDEPQLRERYPEPEAAIRAGRAAIRACEVAFVCVPTDLQKRLSDWGDNPTVIHDLDTSIVEDVVGWCDADVIVLRSTVNPGTADALKAKTGKRIVTQPEYLGETTAHPLLDQSDRPFIILGGEPEDRRKVIETYQGAYNANISIRQVTNYEAEVIKLSENRAILHKVAECQELFDACEAAGVDYYTIRDAVYGDDPRFNLWFSFIYPRARGADSKCIPKDVYAWAAWSESLGYKPAVTNAILERNKEWVASNG